MNLNSITATTSTTPVIPFCDVVELNARNGKASFRASNVRKIELGQSTQSAICVSFVSGETSKFTFYSHKSAKAAYEEIMALWRMAVRHEYAQPAPQFVVTHQPGYAAPPGTPIGPNVPWQPTQGPWSSST